MSVFPRNLLLLWLWLPLSASALVVSSTDLVSKKPVTIDFTKPSKRTVVTFLSPGCPCSQSHEPVLKELSREFPNFQFVGIVSDESADAAELSTHYKKTALDFPILRDPKLKYANHFKALKTPHVFVIDTDGKTLFAGGITDSHQAAGAKRRYLRRALTEIKHNGKPSKQYVRVLGCAIKR